jgi:hypothetical protein
MKVLLTLLLYLPFSSYGQNRANCEILNAFLSNDKVKGLFGLDTYRDVPIVIVEFSNRFSECALRDYYGRRVEIVNDTSYQSVVNHSNIIVYDLVQIRKAYKMKVYFKIRQAYGDVYFKRKKTGFVLSKFEVGRF